MFTPLARGDMASYKAIYICPEKYLETIKDYETFEPSIPVGPPIFRRSPKKALCPLCKYLEYPALQTNTCTDSILICYNCNIIIQIEFMKKLSIIKDKLTHRIKMKNILEHILWCPGGKRYNKLVDAWIKITG
jgi:hypothetical protein